MAKLEEIFTVGWREFLFDVFMSEPLQNLQNILNYVSIQTRALSPLWPMQEKDRTGCGSIHLDQVAEIFRMYEVRKDEGGEVKNKIYQRILTNIYIIM